MINSKISVGMIVRKNLLDNSGGDTTQIQMTAKYLRKEGVEVDILFSGSQFDLEKYDIIHFFNIIRPDDILPYLNDRYKNYVVSTIFVDYSEYEKKYNSGLRRILFNLLNSGQIEYVKAIARWIFNGDKVKSTFYLLRGHKASVRKVCESVQILLPNSISEGQRLCKYLKSRYPFEKVVNAVDVNIFSNDIKEDLRFKDHIICVGRIEGRKNQLNLIHAINQTSLKLTLIGKPSPNHIKYYEMCKKASSGNPNIQFIDQINHSELAGIYKAAKVHVLPSWFETTGLSSLEAGLMGCNLVITRKGDTEEYFGEMAYYCEPDDILSIKDAILRAYQDEVNDLLANYIRENYRWEVTAKQTLRSYQNILGEK